LISIQEIPISKQQKFAVCGHRIKYNKATSPYLEINVGLFLGKILPLVFVSLIQVNLAISWKYFSEMLNRFTEVVHIGLPNSTRRSYGKERLEPKMIMFRRMTETLSSTTAFCRPKKGEGYHGASRSIFGIRIFR